MLAPAAASDERRRPNIVLFFTDDQGYADVGCYGSEIPTPHSDRMAQEGLKFTSFYAQPVCGPSRAAIMSGCYPIRVAEPGSIKRQHTVLHPREVTMAEVLKSAGYATACIGKWHIGMGPSAPNEQGFDYFFGTPKFNGHTRRVEQSKFRTPLLCNKKVLDEAVDSEEMNTLTRRYTEEAVRFIRDHRDEPFFLYLSQNMPHVPLGVSDEFRGRSGQGLYGDVIMELDWSLGRVNEALQELGLDDDTLVLFTSDNGPWIEEQIGNHAGHAGPLRGYKMTTWEGGLRVPCIARWPGKIPGGRVCNELATTLDLLPTFAHLAGTHPPRDRTIDGHDIRPLLLGEPGAKTPYEAFYYYAYTHLQAVRSGPWKLVRPRPAHPPWTGWSARMIERVEETELYNLEQDVSEQHDVADEHPDVVDRLQKLVEKGRRELGDYNMIGEGARFFDKPVPTTAAQRDNRGGGRQQVVYDHPDPVGNLRWDFETGDLLGWEVVEGSFEALVNDRERFHHLNGGAKYNKQGTYFLTTLERAAGGKGKDTQTGVVESPVFRLDGDRMSFLVGGGRHSDTYVALCDAKTDKELKQARGRNSEAMQRINWDVGDLGGRKLYLKIVDHHKGGWGHVTFDDFSTEGSIDEQATERRRKGC